MKEKLIELKMNCAAVKSPKITDLRKYYKYNDDNIFGEGRFSKVYRAISLEDSKVYAEIW